MGKRRKNKPVDAGRRRFLKIAATAGAVMTRLSVIGGVWSLVKDLWSWRPAPAPIVLTPAPVAVAVTPGTGGLVFGSTMDSQSKSYCSWRSTVAGIVRPSSVG